MVKTWSMVHEERIASEMQRLKKKYFGNRSLEMAIPTPVLPMYQGLSGEEVVEAEEDFYYKWKFHVFGLTGEERWACLRTLAKDKVRGSYAGKGPLNLYQLFGGGGYRRCGGGSGGASNGENCNDGKVILSKRYKASDMENGNDASVLELRTVRARNNKCQPHEREKINSSSSSPNNRFVTKNLENTQRERRKIRGINQKLSKDNKWLKRAKGSGSRRWEYSSVVRGKLDSTADSHLHTEAGRTWNDNIIWVKGNCLQRDDDKLLDLQFRSVKKMERKESLLDEVTKETELQLVLRELGLSRKKRVESRSKKVVKAKSTRSMPGVDGGKRQTSGEEVRAKTPRSGSSAQPNLTTSKITQKFLKKQMKKALPASGTTVSGEVAQGLRRRVEPLGGSGEKVAEGRYASVDDLKEVNERARLMILHGKEDTSQVVARPVKGIWLSIEEQESGLKKEKIELEKNLAQAKADALKEVMQLKAVHAVAIGQLQVEAKANFGEIAVEHDKLGRHLMMKGYSQEEVDAIKADTYAEEEEEEAKVLGVVDGLDGVSPQTVLDNQGDDVELPEGGSEKVVREISLRINDLESRLSRERVTSKALLSAQAELISKVCTLYAERIFMKCSSDNGLQTFNQKVELDVSLVREDHTLVCNQEFVEQFDRMKEANENREDQYVEDKDSEIKKGLEDLSAATERAENHQRQVDALAVMGKQADMAQCRILALERT
ncbi:hypothetical protein GIB67_034845 [Kingdonia uniflora]|uniref:Uncharacterized protein n=1 Tax=Kingdonia uniflora TaxID=39325 RepID=A0A7J7MDZ0_9MAGN|nr:hypothetical protein GIB67_034845 [Kingdonia uniflora]